MNVFEDLVIELKEANLLESTVIDLPIPVAVKDVSGLVETPVNVKEGANREVPIKLNSPASDKEFFKKKAIGEVASLQMVEHVITGVEREYMKVVPKTFDDFNAKMALNTFINAEEAADRDAHQAAEFQLMHETEAWCSALALRDNSVDVSQLRLYCERSRPALSSQALLAVGRFYRNLPYSEAVRSKFDFVITRLFSRVIGNEKRVCLFTREEMLVHINTLYSDWSSVPLYSLSEGDSNVTLTVLSFNEMALEAKSAAGFDQLIKSDFFGRVRMFKESISELFYAPEVTAAAILSNIEIGNAYVDLINRERHKIDADDVRTKYADHDVEVSAATGKTLKLASLLSELQKAEPPAQTPERREPVKRERGSDRRTTERRAGAPASKDRPARITDQETPLLDPGMQNAFAVNKWLIIVAALIIAISVALYAWAD